MCLFKFLCKSKTTKNHYSFSKVTGGSENKENSYEQEEETAKKSPFINVILIIIMIKKALGRGRLLRIDCSGRITVLRLI